VAPNQHFYIVSAVSIITAMVAGALALATIQIGLYRVLFLCLGFMSLCAIFAVHGLTTPGMLVPDLFSEYSGSAVAISAYLSLAIPAIFLGVLIGLMPMARAALKLVMREMIARIAPTDARVLVTGESPFDDLPGVMARLAAGSLPALCHTITYDGE